MISESILEGEKVRLRPMQDRDMPLFVQWLQDAEVRRWLASIAEPPTLEEQFDWYEGRRSDPDSVLWSIETLDGRLVGSVELRLAQHAQRAELGIAIQDKTMWSQGLGTDTVRLVMEYGFEDLELHRIELMTDEENVRGRRCYERCGFIEEGLLRQHRPIDGKFGNTIMMSVLRDEWLAR